MPKMTTVTRKIKRRWLFIAGVVVAVLIILSVWLLSSQTPVSAEAPEAGKVLAVQANMPFQIMIPAYLPKKFDRAGVAIDVQQGGPGGEPMAQLTYHTAKGGSLFIREWVPINPAMETLANSRPIQTKWGKGWLLTESDALVALWIDVGPTRVSVYSPSMGEISREEILQVAETLGPPSNNQVFYFDVSAPTIKDMPPPPPFEVPVNADGVQEFTLVITPGGYNPIRFAVQAGKPVKMHFRMLGNVGCGDTLIFPTGPDHNASLKLKSQQDEQILEFTPENPGEYQFFCGHQMYRGVMTVRQSQ